jgi:type II secretory pathway pseudopilin PulG
MGVTRPCPRQRAHAAFTLVEAIIAGGIVMLLFGAAIATLSVTTRTVDPPAAVVDARDVRGALDLFAADIADAAMVSVVSEHSVTLSMPEPETDESEESSPSTITWTYRSDKGTVERTDAAGSSTAVISGVTAFALESFVRREPSHPLVIEATPERMLIGSPHHGTAVEVGPTLLTGYALVASPVLPSTATAWTVTGLRVRGRRGPATANSVTFELRALENGFPSGELLASTQVRGGTFPQNTDWQTIDWSDVDLPASTTAVGVVMSTSSALAPIFLETTTIGRATPWDTFYSGTLVLWTSLGTRDLSYELIGTYTASNSSLSVGVDALRMTLSVSSAPAESHSRTARLATRAASLTVAVEP